MLKLIFLLLISPTTNTDKVKSIYYLCQVEEISITAAIVLFETRRMNCINCALDNGNLFGFIWKGKFKRYISYSESVKYYIKWQKKHWRRFHRKHPEKNYYDFLKKIPYCDKMNQYILIIKSIEKHG